MMETLQPTLRSILEVTLVHSYLNFRGEKEGEKHRFLTKPLLGLRNWKVDGMKLFLFSYSVAFHKDKHASPTSNFLSEKFWFRFGDGGALFSSEISSDGGGV